jgi:hypothetical protein
MLKKGTDKFWTMMRGLNARHGTAFGTSRKDVNTVVGTNSMYGIMAFDQKNRKLAYITKSGKSVEILDYTFIRSWRLTWGETTLAGGGQVGFVVYGSSKTRRHNAVIEIETSDLRRPVIKLRMPTLAYGEQARARLDILING